MGKPMTKIGTVDPAFKAAPGDFFSKLRAGGSYGQPAPQIPAAVPASKVQSATTTPLASSFMGTAAPSQTKPNGYKVVG